jgi:hypothetical protein
MIEREDGRYIGVCDICGSETPRCSTWEKARAYIYRYWLTKKVDGAYEHYCEDCKRQMERDQKKR